MTDAAGNRVNKSFRYSEGLTPCRRQLPSNVWNNKPRIYCPCGADKMLIPDIIEPENRASYARGVCCANGQLYLLYICTVGPGSPGLRKEKI